MSDQSFRDAWLWQARTCENMDAPFTAAILRCMVEDNAVREAVWPILSRYVDDSPRALLLAAMPMRILGGLHFLVLSGAAPVLATKYLNSELDGLGPVLADAALSNSETLARFMQSPPQTNEVMRSFSLIGGFLKVAEVTQLPLRCLELGASAGLNSNWNLYAYLLGKGRRWGTEDAQLTLEGGWTGESPHLEQVPHIVEKRACDQSPIDVRTDAGAVHLQSYIWPEQKHRLDRIRRAIAVARENFVQVDKADAGEWLQRNGDPQEGVATVIFHSIFIQYPSDEVRASILRAIKEKGMMAKHYSPVAWLRMEPRPENPVEVEVRLKLWPSGDDLRLGDVGSHGAPVHWLS